MKKRVISMIVCMAILSNVFAIFVSANASNKDTILGLSVVDVIDMSSKISQNGSQSLIAVYNDFTETTTFKMSAVHSGASYGVSNFWKEVISLGKYDSTADADAEIQKIACDTVLKSLTDFDEDDHTLSSYAATKYIDKTTKVFEILDKVDFRNISAGLKKQPIKNSDLKDFQWYIDEMLPELKVAYPNLLGDESNVKLLKDIGKKNLFDITGDLCDFSTAMNKLLISIAATDANLEVIKDIRGRIDSNTQTYKDLSHILNTITSSWQTNFFNSFLADKLIDEMIGKLLEYVPKIVEGGEGVLEGNIGIAKATLTAVGGINTLLFDMILKVPDIEDSVVLVRLATIVGDIERSTTNITKIVSNGKFSCSQETFQRYLNDSLNIIKICRESLNLSKSIAKHNDEYGTAYVNSCLENLNSLEDRITSALNRAGDKTPPKEDSNSSTNQTQPKVPGTMTVSASKSNYTTKENVVLNWTSSSNATEYGLTVKRVEDGKTIFNSRLNGSSKNLGCLEAGTYTYVMRGHNANGKGPLTPVKQFTVEASNKNNIPEGNGDGYLYKSLDKDTSKPDFPGKWIRTSASTSGTVIGSIPYGEMAVGTKFSSDGKWVYVNYKNVEGWVMLTSDIFPYQGIYTCPVVTFNANGGSVTTSNKKVFINTPYGKLPTPERNNYMFDGWYTSSNGGTKITSSTNVTLTANQTLYAHWIEEEKDDETANLTITFDPMGGKVSPASKKGEFNTPYGSLPTPTRNGYVFLGWYTVKGGGGNEVTSTHYVMRNYDHTLYAHWDVSDDQTCIITYNANGGIEPPSPQTVNEGERVTISNEKLSRSGYEFLGWSKNASSNKADYTPGQKVTINEDIMLYAVWKAKDESFVLTIGDTKANVFGQIKYNDVAPIIENNRTMLPARFIAENLGADVEWIDKTRCVLITKEDTEIEIFIGNEYAKVNGEKYKLDSPAFIRDNRTYTPVRFICENLGANVEWNDKEKSVKITLIKCSVCGSTNHTEHIESDGWEESLPAFVKNNQDDYVIEKRTEYLYETRETTTSDKNKKSGWTLYDTKTSEGSWSKWQEQKVTETSTRIVETREVKATYKTQYNYGAYVTKAGTHKPCLHLTDSSQEVWTGWLDYELPIKYSPDDVKGWYCATCASKVDSSRAGGKIINVKDKGGNKYFWYTYYQNNATENKNEFYWKNERVVEDTPSHIEYRYKNIENVYYFERWTEGEWTSKKKSENSNCRLVDTRTVYKYESR